MNAKNFLKKVKSEFFPQLDVKKVIGLNDEERREFVIQQVERLITDADYPDDMHISEMAGKYLKRFGESKTNLQLYLDPERDKDIYDKLTEDERKMASFYHEIADDCQWLLNGLLPFYNKKTKGREKEDDICRMIEDNILFVKTTPYRHCAFYTAYSLKQVAIYQLQKYYYNPGADYLAELGDEKYGIVFGKRIVYDIPPEEYIDILLNAIFFVQRHINIGHSLGLTDLQIVLHDSIRGHIYNYDQKLFPVVEDLSDYILQYTDYFEKCRIEEESDTNAERFSFVDKAEEKYLEGLKDRVKSILKDMNTDDLDSCCSLSYEYLMDIGENYLYFELYRKDPSMKKIMSIW